jgi:hypothetical protein
MIYIYGIQNFFKKSLSCRSRCFLLVFSFYFFRTLTYRRSARHIPLFAFSICFISHATRFSYFFFISRIEKRNRKFEMSKAILITFTYKTFTRKCKRLTRNWQRNILTHHEYGFYFFLPTFFLFLPNAYSFIHKLVIHQIKEQYSCLNYSFLSSIVLY